MAAESRLGGLVLKVGPLGERDRLITLLTDADAITRLAAPGARRPGSSLAAAAPFAVLELQVVGRRGLRRIRQLRVLQSFGRLGQRLDLLAAAQTLMELALALVPDGASCPGLLEALRLHLGQLEEGLRPGEAPHHALAVAVKGCVQLLALGGFALPLQRCCCSGAVLEPPLGDWQWRCSLLPGEGVAIGSRPGAALELNASELALLQRLLRPRLPRRRSGELMGPAPAWLQLLACVHSWTSDCLDRPLRSLELLRGAAGPGAEGSGVSEHGPRIERP
ncbi:DNA repair protein RecO [Synechococcus sp. RSCCF101]|uniref:DNA repair protein RecO n=1 Tax=Synechococcus sp. RSCCF101 TaxID=2511069 RepID=UPI001248E3E3|nr:DNA repair protein RecO [Synechococcus sp. RSCCF101]QEY33188.1 DNA repair protein RecO [Synechococcus sp. RSCCF101]